ncbi:unnamed protein product [Heterosigma akashiwo]|mmetsp:Transcript_32012/g.51980  ORF Transcript_32012/g.51980 Transcript_32012/m.51980 type:complete len:88 (+) Transcript_32012:107-370(+)
MITVVVVRQKLSFQSKDGCCAAGKVTLNCYSIYLQDQQDQYSSFAAVTWRGFQGYVTGKVLNNCCIFCCHTYKYYAAVKAQSSSSSS